MTHRPQQLARVHRLGQNREFLVAAFSDLAHRFVRVGRAGHQHYWAHSRIAHMDGGVDGTYSLEENVHKHQVGLGSTDNRE